MCSTDYCNCKAVDVAVSSASEMAKGQQTLLLGMALTALVALVAAAPPMDKEGMDKRDEAAAKMKARARPVRVRACC